MGFVQGAIYLRFSAHFGAKLWAHAIPLALLRTPIRALAEHRQLVTRGRGTSRPYPDLCSPRTFTC